MCVCVAVRWLITPHRRDRNYRKSFFLLPQIWIGIRNRKFPFSVSLYLSLLLYLEFPLQSDRQTRAGSFIWLGFQLEVGGRRDPAACVQGSVRPPSGLNPFVNLCQGWAWSGILELRDLSLEKERREELSKPRCAPCPSTRMLPCCRRPQDARVLPNSSSSCRCIFRGKLPIGFPGRAGQGRRLRNYCRWFFT